MTAKRRPRRMRLQGLAVLTFALDDASKLRLVLEPVGEWRWRTTFRAKDCPPAAGQTFRFDLSRDVPR